MTHRTDPLGEPISRLDLSSFETVPMGTPVAKVVQQLRRSRMNCAMILKEGELVGIFTDRDVLNKVAGSPEVLDRPIEELMTPFPSTISPQATAAEALEFLDRTGYRTVPVVDDQGDLVGNLSYRALMHHLSDHFPVEVYNLPPDPEKAGRKREGA
jgi:CBS domain-containing protein